MKDFGFNLTTKIEFGKGYIEKAGMFAKKYNAKKVMIVTDKGLLKAGIAGIVIDSLEKEGIENTVYDGVRPNPRDKDCIKAGDIAVKEGIDFIIAVGGGSSMDTAKAVASLITNKGPFSAILKPNKVAIAPVPLMCIPTTAGTGSEVTSFAVITLDDEKRKTCMFDDKIRPTIALVDPQLLINVPSPIVASTGIDALTHAIEAYTCKLANPITDALALAAIKYIAQNLRTLMYERTYESAEGMMLGSLLAGLAFGFSDIASVHCLAEAIGGYYDTPHGVANSIFLPVVFEYNIPANLTKHKEVAIALGVDPLGKSNREVAQEAVRWLSSLSKDAEIPSLKGLGYVDPEKFDMLADICMLNVSTPSNAREISKEKYVELFNITYNRD